MLQIIEPFATEARLGLLRGPVLILALTLATGCSESAPVEAIDEEAEQVDLLFHNGQILTVDDTFTVHSVLVVNDGKVVDSGDQDLMAKFRAATTVDLQGKTLMPGFVDSHTHISGDAERYIDLTNVGSIVEM